MQHQLPKTDADLRGVPHAIAGVRRVHEHVRCRQYHARLPVLLLLAATTMNPAAVVRNQHVNTVTEQHRKIRSSKSLGGNVTVEHSEASRSDLTPVPPPTSPRFSSWASDSGSSRGCQSESQSRWGWPSCHVRGQ
eukprot:1673288-Rhodomonas_salina.2